MERIKIAAFVVSTAANFGRKVADKAAHAGGTALAVGAVAASGIANATPTASGIVDWTTTAADVKAEMTPGITAGLTVGAVILGLTVAYKVFRRFVR